MDGDASQSLAAVERALRERLGVEPERAAVSFVGVEPIEVLRFRVVGRPLCYVTLGMSRQPMGGGGQRAELMLDAWRDRGELWRRLAVLAAAPTVEGAVFAPGATVDIGGPLDVDSRCTGVVVDDSEFDRVAAAGDPVTILRLLPATPNELAWARVWGVAALRGRWADQSVDLADLHRSAVRLPAT